MRRVNFRLLLGYFIIDLAHFSHLPWCLDLLFLLKDSFLLGLIRRRASVLIVNRSIHVTFIDVVLRIHHNVVLRVFILKTISFVIYYWVLILTNYVVSL